MPEINYKDVGLKCGLEIHQQLDTSKLFCNCPSLLRSGEPDFVIKRKLHAVAGESGEIDIAAKHEAEQEKEFVYQGYDTTCLVELDEEPPHEINKEALKIALQISLLLHAKIFPLTQIMRKTVIDGSNTSGFQRTVLIARDGYVETDSGRVGIESICLEEDSARKINSKKSKIFSSSASMQSVEREEDSARIVRKEDKQAIFRLDRLGIPLIEIATAPDIKTPEQAKEVALHIGEILRSCKVKRGIGTIRQDVNVSISKGARTEIKGFQEPAMMIKTIDSEIERQLNLIKKGKKVEESVRNALADGTTEYLRPMPGAARMYPETDLPILKISRNLVNEAKKDLPKLRKEIRKDLEKMGLNKDMIKLLFKQNKFEEFKALLKIINKPVLVAKVLLMYPREIAKRNKKSLEEVEEILDAYFEEILIRVKKGEISEGHIKSFIEKIIKGEKFELPIEDISVIEEKIIKIINDKPGLSDKAYMGLVMKEFGGKISGREAMEIIKKNLK